MHFRSKGHVPPPWALEPDRGGQRQEQGKPTHPRAEKEQARAGPHTSNEKGMGGLPARVHVRHVVGMAKCPLLTVLCNGMKSLLRVANAGISKCIVGIVGAVY